MSFSEKDQDIWKNYQDYPDEYGMLTEKEKNEMVKIIVGVSLVVLLIPAGIIAFRKKVAIKIAFANLIRSIRGFFQSIADRIRNFRNATPNAPPTVELSIIHPTAIEFPESVVAVPTPPPPRYLSTRAIHICDQDASERRLREVSAVLNQFMHEPLPQFHFDTSISESDVSTADSIQNRVSTPMDRTRVILQSMESLDPSGMLTPQPVVPNNTLDDNPLQVDDSEGSVMEIADFPMRQHPVRSTRNKVPIYKDPSDNENE